MLLGLYVLQLPIFSTGGHAGFPVCGAVSKQVRPACGAVRCWSTDRTGAVEHSCIPRSPQEVGTPPRISRWLPDTDLLSLFLRTVYDEK